MTADGEELNGQMALGADEESAEEPQEEEPEASGPDFSQEKIPFKKKDLMIQQRIYDMILYAYPACVCQVQSAELGQKKYRV